MSNSSLSCDLVPKWKVVSDVWDVRWSSVKCNVDQSLINVNTASKNTTSGTRCKLTEKGTYFTVLAVF